MLLAHRRLQRRSCRQVAGVVIVVRAGSQVWFQGRRYTFSQFYRQMIDDRYAGLFLEQLYNLADVEQEGQRLWAVQAREIARWLRQAGLHDDQTDLLATWWLIVCTGGALSPVAISLNCPFSENWKHTGLSFHPTTHASCRSDTMGTT